MASNIGTDIVNSGLVFHYDMNNDQKSWKGKPTTNLYVGTETSAGSEDGFGGGSYLDTSLTTLNPFGAGNITARKSNSGVATWSVRATLTEGVTYTYSVWCRTIADTSINLRRNEPSVYLAESKSVNVTPGVWTRVSFTFTVNAGKSGSQVVGINVGNANAGQANNGFYLTRAQLEQSSFATPYVNDSRSNTQAIVDIAGGNTVTANSLTYNSNGTFAYSAVENYVSFPAPQLSNSTFEFVYTKNANSTYNTIYNQVSQQTTNGYHWLFTDSSTMRCQYVNSSNIVNGYWADTFTQGVVSHYSLVFNVSSETITFYKNGSQFGSTLTATGMKPVAASIGYIGTYQASGTAEYALNGDMPLFKVYNRALSASEVKQNFEATRSRYGI